MLGPDHPDTALSLNNLAALYRAQGKLTEAEPLYRRALEICERVLGPDHPDTALSLNNLAALYRAQGKLTEAEPLYRRALEIRERVLGPDHPDTATSLNNLAFLYKAQGKLTEAELLCRRAWRFGSGCWARTTRKWQPYWRTWRPCSRITTETKRPSRYRFGRWPSGPSTPKAHRRPVEVLFSRAVLGRHREKGRH